MQHYQDLAQRYGEVAAFALLLDMERRVKINSASIAHIEPDVRFQNALILNDNFGQKMAKMA